MDSATSFAELRLDARLLKSLAHQRLAVPTPIQRRCMGPMLAGRNLCAQARTGSGKTLAYLLPILHRLLEEDGADATCGVLAVVLVPTKELAAQVCGVAKKLLKASRGDEIRVANMTAAAAAFAAVPEKASALLVATPAKLLAAARARPQMLQPLATLVLDEADMMISFGYDEDVRELLGFMPATYQTVLMSATLTSDIEKLKELLLTEPVEITLKDIESKAVLKQLRISARTRDERFLLAYVLLKLKLPARSKTLVFTNSIDTAYKLRLYLEQFGVRSCVLNADMPVNSRYHTVQEFNRGVINVMIATDFTESAVEAEGDDKKESADKKDAARRAAEGRDKFTVARGIDFRSVNTVLNFDLPGTTESYTHRIGRTARGEQNGLAITFTVDAAAKGDEALWRAIVDAQRAQGASVDDYVMPAEIVQALEYRAEDALRSVTSLLVQQAKTSDIKKEILNSEKLKTYFEENPQDLRAVRHDLPTVGGAKVTGGSLKSLPAYTPGTALDDESIRKISYVARGRKGKQRGGGGGGSRSIKRKVDPLKNLSFANKRKK